MKCKDRHLAILYYKTTPLEKMQASPAQLLMGRRPRNSLPAVKSLYKPKTISRKSISKGYYKNKADQKFYHDRKTKTLPKLEKGSQVRIQPAPGQKRWIPGQIIDRHQRSYHVQLENGTYRRNRRHIRRSTEQANAERREQSLDDKTSSDDEDLRLQTTTKSPTQSGTSNSSLPLVEVPSSPTSR